MEHNFEAENLAPLFRFAWALSGSESSAIDLTHHVLGDDAWHRHQTSQSHSSQVAVYKTTYRIFTGGEPLPVPPIHDQVALLDAASLHYASKLTSDSLLESFRKLELPQRAALVLFYITRCSLHDIAEVMDRSEDEIVSIIARGKAEWLHILQSNDATGGRTPKKKKS